MSCLADAFALAASQDGLVSRAQLIEARWPERSIADRVDRGEFVTVQPGVYRVGSTPLGRAQLLRSVRLRAPDALLSHTTGGQLWTLRAMSDRRVHALVEHGSSPGLRGVVVHRCRRIDPVDINELDNGLKVTSPQRTIFDAASIIGLQRTESALEHALERELFTIEVMMATVERLGHPLRPGTSVIRRVLASRPLWAGAVQSELELRMVRALTKAGFPEPSRQFAVDLGTFTVHLDLAYPQWMIGLEIDHRFWHDRNVAVQRDKERDRRLTARGWRIIRVTDHDLTHSLDAVLADLRAVIALAS